MTPIGMVFTLIASVFIATLPRRLAPIPLLLGALFITRGQILMVGPAHFTVVQILITVGMIRALLKGEFVAGGINNVDRLIILWAIWMFGSSAFHTSDAWVFRSGILWTHLGSYFLFRIFIQEDEDIKYVFKAICVFLVPVAILMLLENRTGKDYIAALGGVTEFAEFREGRFRAHGAFGHAILAGTVGAGCFSMALYFWKRHREFSLLGLFGAGGVVFSASSSGPIMMLLFSILGLFFWKIRIYLQVCRRLALVILIVLDLVMEAPVYFLMARIDITGGSTGYYRAQLIRSGIEHLQEWWSVGTDYTRHWMATGQHANEQHTDLTNHFLAMGVSGGLLLIFLFVLVLTSAFNMVGKTLRENENAPTEHCYLAWTLGATLFGYVWVFFSISLFDQSVVFFYLILASISAVQATKHVADVAANAAKQPVIGIRQSRYVTAGENNTREVLASRKQIRFGVPVID